MSCIFDFIGANIFVSSSGLIKLGDFGSAVRLKDPIRTMRGEVSKFRGTAGKPIEKSFSSFRYSFNAFNFNNAVLESSTAST